MFLMEQILVPGSDQFSRYIQDQSYLCQCFSIIVL